MTRRGVISIHDYPEHLNPFREDEDEVQRKYTRKERGGPALSARHGTPSQSPVKPERPPLPNRTKIKDKENEVGRRDEDKYFRQGTKPKKKRPAPLPPSPNQLTLSPGVSDGSLDKTTKSAFQNAMDVSENSPEKEEQSTSVPTDAESPKIEDSGTLADARDTHVEVQESPVNGAATAAAPDVLGHKDEESCSEGMDRDQVKEATHPKTDEAKAETEEATELKVCEISPREEATCNGQSDEINTNGDVTELTVVDPKSNPEEDEQTETDGTTPDASAPPEEENAVQSEKTEMKETTSGDEIGSEDGDPKLLETKPCDPESPSKTPPVDSKEKELNGVLKTEELTKGTDGGLDGVHADTEGTTLASQADIPRKE